MTNIVPFNGSAFQPAVLDDDLDDIFKPNIGGGESLPKLSIKGKVWAIVKDDNREVIKNQEDEAVSTIEVVVLAQTTAPDGRPSRTRSYFEGVWDPDTTKAPDCFSNDGQKPSEDSSKPQSLTCATCPKSIKGSHTDGKRTACQQGKRLVVVPSNDLTQDAFYIQLPITSIWVENEQYREKGWYSWDGYMKLLRGYKVKHTALVATKMRFAPDSEYPQVLFKVSGQLDNEGLRTISERLDSDEVKSLLGLNRGYATKVYDPDAEDDELPVAKAEDDDDLPVVKASPEPKAEKKEPVKRQTKAKVAPVEEDDDLESSDSSDQSKALLDALGDDDDWD